VTFYYPAVSSIRSAYRLFLPSDRPTGGRDVLLPGFFHPISLLVTVTLPPHPAVPVICRLLVVLPCQSPPGCISCQLIGGCDFCPHPSVSPTGGRDFGSPPGDIRQSIVFAWPTGICDLQSLPGCFFDRPAGGCYFQVPTRLLLRSESYDLNLTISCSTMVATHMLLISIRSCVLVSGMWDALSTDRSYPATPVRPRIQYSARILGPGHPARYWTLTIRPRLSALDTGPWPSGHARPALDNGPWSSETFDRPLTASC
jgi:hypothetical protein